MKFLFQSFKKYFKPLYQHYRNVFPAWTIQDQKMLEFYVAFLQPGDLCFDVGANYGGRSKIFLKLGARAIAVEPQKPCQEYLRKVFGKNPSWVLVPQAVGPSEGEVEMMLCETAVLSTVSSEWV